MAKSTEYNGWKNKATWNVALHLSNDEFTYRAIIRNKDRILKSRRPYAFVVACLGLQWDRTPDGFKYTGARLCRRELNEMVREMVA